MPSKGPRLFGGVKIKKPTNPIKNPSDPSKSPPTIMLTIKLFELFPVFFHKKMPIPIEQSSAVIKVTGVLHLLKELIAGDNDK